MKPCLDYLTMVCFALTSFHSSPTVTSLFPFVRSHCHNYFIPFFFESPGLSKICKAESIMDFLTYSNRESTIP